MSLLDDLQVFSEFAYESRTEILQQQTDLFNDASGGAFVLDVRNRVGDFADRVSWKKLAGGTVRRRNAYGDDPIPEKRMTQMDEAMVKVAAGTFPIRLDPSQMKWIQRDPEEAGAMFAIQLAKDTMADMVNLAVGVLVACTLSEPDVVSDVSATVLDVDAGESPKATPVNLNRAVSKLGDAGGRVALWVMHSVPMYGLFENALMNKQRLFEYGDVHVTQDGFGRRYIMADVPAFNLGSGKYVTLGVTPGAVTIEQQGDYTENYSTLNGKENITRTYQAEWSYETGVRGFSYNKRSGGKSPQDAALVSSANWTREVTSHKNLPAIAMISAG